MIEYTVKVAGGNHYWFLFITLIVIDAWNCTPEAYTTPPEETFMNPIPPAPPKPN